MFEPIFVTDLSLICSYLLHTYKTIYIYLVLCNVRNHIHTNICSSQEHTVTSFRRYSPPVYLQLDVGSFRYQSYPHCCSAAAFIEVIRACLCSYHDGDHYFHYIDIEKQYKHSRHNQLSHLYPRNKQVCKAVRYFYRV